jgi:hypothetical protein
MSYYVLQTYYINLLLVLLKVFRWPRVENTFFKGRILASPALEYVIRKVQGNEGALKLDGTHQVMVYADDVSIMGKSTRIVKKNTEALLVTSKKICLKVNVEKTKYMFIYREQNAEKYHNINVGNKYFEIVKYFEYLGTTLRNQSCIHEEIKSRFNSGMPVNHSVQDLLPSRLLSKNIKMKEHITIILPVVLYGCETRSLTLKE